MSRWLTKPLRELIAIEKGKKAPEILIYPTKTSLRYLQIDDLRPEASLKYCEPFTCSKASKTDAIIAWDGANAGTVSCNLEGYIGSTLAVLRPVSSDVLSATFLSRFLQGNFAYLQRTATGATIPHISKEALNAMQIPLPPLAEQERIVKFLDDADELRKLRAQADRRTADLIPALFHEMFGDPITNIRNWKREIFKDLLDGIDSGWSPICHDRPAKFDEWGVLKLGAVTSCEYIDIENKARKTLRLPRRLRRGGMSDLGSGLDARYPDPSDGVTVAYGSPTYPSCGLRYPVPLGVVAQVSTRRLAGRNPTAGTGPLYRYRRAI